MRTRLTEQEVELLNLEAVNWTRIREAEIERIYIRAYPESPMYGPYKVVDAEEQLISKLDGTEERYYPRDKGLFAAFKREEPVEEVSDTKEEPLKGYDVSWWTLDKKGRLMLNPKDPAHTKLIVKSLLKITDNEIVELENKLDSLYERQESLEDLLDRL